MYICSAMCALFRIATCIRNMKNYRESLNTYDTDTYRQCSGVLQSQETGKIYSFIVCACVKFLHIHMHIRYRSL
jgi:hypothetical protein